MNIIRILIIVILMTGSIFSFAQDCKYEIGVDLGARVRLV
jgi:hypothetical protein